MINLLPCAVLIALACSATADQGTSIVRFANGDRLNGSVTSLTPDQIIWDSNSLAKPAPFFIKSLMEVTLPGNLTDLKADHEAIVTLTNGDIARGKLVSVSEESVTVDTAYADRLNFKRVNVKNLKIVARTASLYQGPTSIVGWKTTGSKPAWTYGNAAFRSNNQGGIGREEILPEECSVAFDIAWKGEAFGFRIVMFSKDITRTDGESGYEFTFQRGGFFVKNCKTNSFIGNGQSQEFLENEKVRIEIRASRKTGKMCLLINDHINETWNDTDFKRASLGSGLQFISIGTLPIRISNIVVGPWDGKIDQVTDPQVGMIGGFGQPRWGRPATKATPNKETVAEGRMELANGDLIEGEPTSIKDGSISIKTPMGDVKLPVARLRGINLKKDNPETSMRLKGDVRAWFPDGSSLVFRLDAVNGESLTGYSQNFGTATIKLGACSRIEFNIHDPELEDKRGNGDW